MNTTERLSGPKFIAEVVGVETTLALVLILVNSVELFIFFKGLDTLKQQKCVISLIVSDLLFGLLAVPLCISLFMGYPRDVVGCSSIISLYLALESLETLSIVLILIEMYFSKLYPMKFIIHATGRRTNGNHVK